MCLDRWEGRLSRESALWFGVLRCILNFVAECVPLRETIMKCTLCALIPRKGVRNSSSRVFHTGQRPRWGDQRFIHNSAVSCKTEFCHSIFFAAATQKTRKLHYLQKFYCSFLSARRCFDGMHLSSFSVKYYSMGIRLSVARRFYQHFRRRCWYLK